MNYETSLSCKNSSCSTCRSTTVNDMHMSTADCNFIKEFIALTVRFFVTYDVVFSVYVIWSEWQSFHNRRNIVLFLINSKHIPSGMLLVSQSVMNQSVMNQSINQSVNQSVSHESISHSPTKQLEHDTINQSVSQSVSQSINHYHLLVFAVLFNGCQCHNAFCFAINCRDTITDQT